MARRGPNSKSFRSGIKWVIGITCLLPLSLAILLIPRSLVAATGRILGKTLFRLLSRERSVALTNLRDSVAFLTPGENQLLTDNATLEIARKCFINLTTSFIETIKLYFGRGNAIIDSVTLKGVENYRTAAAKGKGVILITGHCGNWELMAIAAIQHIGPISVVAKPQPHSFFNRLTERLRSRYGNSVIYKDGAARKIFFTLRKGGVVGILIDQVVSPAEGELVEFLGRRAWVTKTPPLLAEKSGAPLVPSFIHREGNRHVVEMMPEIEPVTNPDGTLNSTEMLRRLNGSIEEFIIKHPDEWLWMYKRWKNVN